MAIRYSAKEQAATAAAKAIRDYNNAASNLTNRAAALDAVSGKQQSGGLGSILAGIGQSLGNIGSTFATATNDVFNGWKDIIAGNDINAENSFTQQGRKKILGGENAKERYGMAGGKALDAAATLSDFIPGVGANPLFNVVQGAASGFGQAKADNPNASGEELRNAALVGGVSGAAGALSGKALGKVAQAAPKSKIGQKLANAATSQLGRGAIGGATAGATGAGLATALNGGDLASVLANAAQGAKGGALGGATMAGLMGLGGTLYGKAKNRAMGSQNGTGAVEAPVTNELPTNAQKAATSAQNAPEAEVLPRKIAITDYDAGTEQVPVTINRTTKQPNGRGRFIDGYTRGENLPEGLPRTRKGYINDVVRGKNLPEAELPTNDAMLRKLFGMEDYEGDKVLAEAIGRGEMGDDTMTIDYLKGILSPAEMSAVRGNAADYWESTHDDGVFGKYKSKSALPKIDLEDYKDYIGRKGMTRADIDPELLPFLEQGGRKLGSNDWGDIGLESGEYTQDDIIDAYKRFANTDMRRHYYTNENIGAGLYLDEPLYNRVAEKVIGDSTMAPRKIDVTDGASRSDIIPVRNGAEMPAEVPQAPQGMAEPTYTRRTLNEQPQTAITPRQSAEIAPQPQTELIQPGTPEYAEFMRQEQLANRRRELEQTIIGGISDQYGTTRLSDRINGLPEAMLDMAELGLTNRAQIDGFANRVTGKNGIASKVIRTSLDKAGDVDARIPMAMDEVYQRAGAGANKNVQQKVARRFDDAGMKYKLNEDGTISRLDMYDLGKELEKEGYMMIDRGERNQNGDDKSYGEALRILSEQYLDKATNGVDVASNIDINALKNALPGNEKWAARVEELANKPNLAISDVRSFMANPTKMMLLAEAEQFNRGTYGQRVADAANTAGQAIRAATSANPATALVQIGATKAISSKAGKQRNIKNAQKQLDQVNAGELPANTVNKLTNAAGAPLRAAKGIAGTMFDILNDETLANKALGGNEQWELPRTNIKIGTMPSLGELAQRQIGRQGGIQEAQYAQNRNELQNATTDFENAYNDYATAGQAAQQAQAKVDAISDGYQQTNQLDKISRAMDLAMAAGDMKAWAQLADLYGQASKIYATEEKEPKALSANQSKALVGLQQLDTLSQMTPDAGAALANSPLGFAVNLAGGNDYANQAQSLALTLGYLQSGANITPQEAEKIGASYIPSAFDSEEVRQNKLARARQLLQGYLSDTSALE